MTWYGEETAQAIDAWLGRRFGQHGYCSGHAGRQSIVVGLLRPFTELTRHIFAAWDGQLALIALRKWRA